MTQTNHSAMFARTLDLVYIAAGAALIAVCSWLYIPLQIPYTLQTFAVFLNLSLLGGKRGTASVLVYLLLGAAGIPVFAEFTGGLGILLGNTGGYLWGFLFTGLLYWLSELLFGKKTPVQIAGLVLGLIACYAFGTVWFKFLYTRKIGSIGTRAVLSWCVFPFILPDLVKLVLALVLARRLRHYIGSAEPGSGKGSR
ncbi:MAG: biotin transporter BioY [Oscillospiraceae bacterium]|nr:biotin transporter BioY [Oscillospiraceae bacterium]